MNNGPVRKVEEKVEKIFAPFKTFIESQTSTSVGLLVSTVLAMIFANSGFHSSYSHLIHVDFGWTLGTHSFQMPVKEWVSSGTMAFFFFLLGLEMKREVFAGELNGPKKLGMVLMAALGGMVLPALLFWVMNLESEYQNGWAIPLATDTAFAIGLLGFLSRKVSGNLFVFLTGLAIFDDLGAIFIIAIYYSNELNMTNLGISAILLALIFVTNLSGLRNGWVYFILGIVLWWYVHGSGIHGTVAGVLVALAVPARTHSKPDRLPSRVKRLISEFTDRRQMEKDELADQEQFKLLNKIEDKAKAATTPLQRWESKLENPVGLLVLPVFALCNAGIRLADLSLESTLTSPLVLGIVLGLVAGKPVGIVFFSWLAVRLRIGILPEGVTFRQIFGMGMLAGIGFTMSIFISLLAFPENPKFVEQAKLGILISSLFSGVLGFFWITCFCGRPNSRSNS